MIKLEKDAIYRAVRARTGSSEKGDWALVSIADANNSKRTMTIFVDNGPVEIREGQMFKVLSINSVKYGFKKDQAGQWKPETSASADIEPIPYEGDEEDGDQNPWDLPGWDELPM